jgi:hypothetical protein
MDEDGPTTHEARRFFSPLPSHGPWTGLGLTRAQFLGIVLGATLLYLFAGGPLWVRLGENDFARIAVSYAVIPVAVAAALWRNRKLSLTGWLVATAVIAILKLLLTAGLALLLGVAVRAH